MENELKNTNGNQIHNLENNKQQVFQQSNINVAFQNHQQSFNEVQDNYSEAAFNDSSKNKIKLSDAVDLLIEHKERKKIKRYDYEKNSPAVVKTEEFIRIKGLNNPNNTGSYSSLTRKEQFGTAEAPGLSKRTTKLYETREKRANLKLPYKNKRLIYTDSKRRLHTKKENHILTERQYNIRLIDKYKRSYTRRQYIKIGFRFGKKLLNDSNIAFDEGVGELTGATKSALRGMGATLRNNTRNLRQLNNPYERLRSLNAREEILSYKRTRYINKQDYKLEKENAKKDRKKQQSARQNRKKREGSFIQRRKQQFFMGKKDVAQKIKAVKKVFSTILSSLSIITVVIMIIMIGFLILLALIDGTAETYANAVTQNDYYVISDSTAFFRKLETDLEERLNDRELLEAELKETYGYDIYEFIYDLADFGFRADTIMAYLSAMYGSFQPEDVTSDLEELFNEMYTLRFEIQMEYRDIPYYDETLDEIVYREELKKICYVILEKRELEEIVEERLPDDKKEQYNGYKLSTGGQQVYGPVIKEDWQNLISSNYGERIHPITGERTFHKGVDIAIPTGTMLYSAIEGEVIIAKYSESAGNYVSVRTQSGWTVTYMHMDNISVRVGQEIEQGEYIGQSGNTGRSTGAHLHLQVEDTNGNTINPIFIIPQTCVIQDTQKSDGRN